MSDRADRMIDDGQGIKISQCSSCMNWIGDGICNAFPKGVPSKILQNEHDHRQPFKGDNGILFILDISPEELDIAPL